MFEQILEEIKNHQEIIIYRHVNPDPDAIGSQFGLREIIKTSFPKKKVHCYGNIPENLEFIAKQDNTEMLSNQSLSIILDTANQERIDGEVEEIKKSDKIIKIDHHPNKESYGDLELINTMASSTSEMIFDFYHQFKDQLVLTDQCAKMLYAGLVGDTGRFLHNNTTDHTLFVASQLRSYNFDFNQLNRNFIEKSLELVHLSGYVQNNVQVNNHVAHIIISNQLLEDYNVKHEDTSSLVGILGTIKGVECWMVFIEQKDHPGKYRCRLRSKQIPIEPIASKYQGGGHPLASGATAENKEEISKILEDVNQLVLNNL